jgi:NIPSNAP
MIYELRTYTVKPGTLGDIVKAASTVSREIRKDDFGKLEGYWMTEIGPLNQVMHMWSYRDYDERTRLRAELGKNPRWTGEYLPLLRPLLLRQDVRLLNAIRAPVAPETIGNVYELRNYRAKPAGAARQWLDAFTAVLPAREKYSKIVRAVADRGGTAERSLPHLGLSQPERTRRSPRRRHEGSGLAGISGQGPAAA